MKFFYCLVTLLFSSAIAFAQYRVTGSVLDQDNNPVAFAEIYLLDTDGALATQTLSDEKGIFLFESVKGNSYRFQLYSYGILQVNQTVNVTADTDLGKMVIENSTLLNEILLTSSKKIFERKIDRTVFNVENAVTALNSDALETLKMAPGLKIDNESISIIGKNNVRVLINDRFVQMSGEDLINYLKSIPANNIQKIEIITAPPAKYEAEGNSGLVNIVLKSSKINAWSNKIEATQIQADRAYWRLGNLFNYNKDKISLSININGNIGKSNSIEKLDIFYPQGLWSLKNIATRNEDKIAATAQFDYRFNDKTTVGIQYIGNSKKPSDTDVVYTDIYEGKNIDYYTNTFGKKKEYTKSNALNAHLLHQFDSLGTKIAVDVDYFEYQNDKNRAFITIPEFLNGEFGEPFSAANFGKQHIDNFSTKIDIDQPLKWFSLSYGGKLSFTTTNNKTNYFDLNQDFPVEDLSQRDNFEYKENTQAFYVSGQKSLSDKWQIQTGLRLENTQTTGTSRIYKTSDKKEYVQLFPSVYIGYTPAENHSLSASYNKRIARPSFWELNPFRWYINQFSYAEGNPALQPAFTDNFELSHTYQGKLITSVSLSKTTENFTQYPTIDSENNTQIYLRDNIFNTTDITLSETYILDAFHFLQSQTTATLFYKDMSLLKDIDIPANNGTGIYITTDNTFSFNPEKTIQAQLNFWYQSPVKFQIYDLGESYAVNLGFKYALLNKKLQLSVYANDILKTSSPSIKTNTNNVDQIYNMYYDNRYIRVGLTFSFGNESIKVKQHDGSNTEEKNRS